MQKNITRLVYSCFVLAVFTFTTTVSAQGIWQKAVGKIAKVAGKVGGAGMLFGTSSSLSELSPMVIYRSNLYPKKVGAMEVDMFGKGWQDGGDAIMFSMIKRRGVKMNKLEGGSITVDGQPAIFQDLGVYTFNAPHSDKPHKVEMVSANGEKSSFTITPLAAQTRIQSINGQSSAEVNADLTKDLVLELSNPGDANGAWIQVTITASRMGLNTFYEVGHFAPAAKLVITPEMIRNTGFPDDFDNPSLANAYLQVARVKWDAAQEVSGVYKQLTIANAALDGRFLKVTSKPDFTSGIKDEGSLTGKNQKIEWAFSKPEISQARPFGQAKKIGIVSLGTRGVSSAESHDAGRTTGVQTDAWASFTPTTAFLDNINSQLYEGVVKATKAANADAVFVSPEVVANTKAWKESNFMAETNDGTATSYARAYKTDKLLSDLALQISFRPVTDGQTLADEAGVDALLSVVFELSLDLDKGGNMSLTPKLNYTLYGKPSGINVSPAIIAQGTVQAKDLKVTKKTTEAELLEKLALTDMVAALETALRNIQQKENTAGYAAYWLHL